MIWVENLKLRGKLVLILILPMLFLLLLSAYMVNSEWQKQNRLQNLAHAGQLTNVVTGLIHELQLERGRSGGFLQNKGQLFHQELIQQRQATDLAWKNFTAAIAQKQGKLKLNALIQISQRFSQLQQLRNQSDLQEIKAEHAVKGYSLFTGELFTALEKLAIQANDTTIARYLNGYHSLSKAKEYAGQERVRGSRMFSSPEDFQNYDKQINTLIIEQKILLEIAANDAPKEVNSLISNLQKLECVKQLHQMREELNQQQAQTDRKTVNQWFNLSTCRINQLRKIELLFMQQINSNITDLIIEARQHLYLILAFTLLPILPSLILILLVDKNVNSVLRWLLNSMQGIASGNFNVSLPAQTRDELGQLSHGLDQLRTKLAKQELKLKQRLIAEQEYNQELAKRTEELQIFSQRIAAGDLRTRLDEKDPILTELSVSLNQMVQGLTALTLKVRGSGTTIKSMVFELHSSINHQSTGANEQAASVSQTMATLEQLRVTSEQTLNKAKALGDIAENARHEGDNGRQAIEQSISDMKVVQAKMDAIAHTILALNEWIQRIGDITGSVHDIARQLRLLSLNASIEASNAGEAGIGFGVVAGEVKQLAERSQQSTIHVQNILEEIRHATDKAVMATEEGSKGVEQGLTQIQRTGDVVRNLESAVGDTSLASRQIVVAVNQEVVGIEQIRTAVKEIHTVTDQFVGAAEQSRGAAEELTDLVKHLDETVNQYQL